MSHENNLSPAKDDQFKLKNMDSHKQLAEILQLSLKLNTHFELRYVEYYPNQWTVPVKLNTERIEKILTDNSIVEIRITLKPN